MPLRAAEPVRWAQEHFSTHPSRGDDIFRRNHEGVAVTRVDEASRLIHAVPTRIYQAFATPDALATWLPPHGMTGRVLEFDFREGGYYRMRLSYSERSHLPGKTSEDFDEVEAQFVKLVSVKRIEQTVTFHTQSPEFSGEMRIVWSFDQTEQGTNVVVRCENVPVGIRAEDHEAGLRSTLENLAAFVENSE